MDVDMSELAMAYVKDHTDDLSQMLVTFWKLIECHNNMEKELEVFAENRKCFGDAVDYVDYAIEMRHLCYIREYRNLLQNRMSISVVASNRYLYNLLYNCLCEWEESSSRRRVARLFLACTPSAYMETVWRKAGAKINGVPEEDVVPEMVWKYPRNNIFETMEESTEDQTRESSDKAENKSDEDYAKLKGVLDDIHIEVDDLSIAYREVLESLTIDELKQIVERMDVSEVGWCILYAEEGRRIDILNLIEDTVVRLRCLKESVDQGEGRGDFRAKKMMPMAFFEKCNEVKNSSSDEAKE